MKWRYEEVMFAWRTLWKVVFKMEWDRDKWCYDVAMTWKVMRRRRKVMLWWSDVAQSVRWSNDVKRDAYETKESLLGSLAIKFPLIQHASST
jgi:hypothetical protein